MEEICSDVILGGETVEMCFPKPVLRRILSTDEDLNDDIDTLWILICAFLVMLMQLGFTLLEIGSVRNKNTINIMFKNLADFCVGCAVWYFWGWALTAASEDSSDPNGFLGSGDVILETSKSYRDWFFSMVFAATAATIVSGAVAERTTLIGYTAYSVLITGWIYPIVVYWVWSGDGFLSAGKEYQMIDFAGSGVVHMVGGFSGLVGTAILGPRIGDEFPPHSISYQVMGVLILLFGWYGFNCGSTLAAVGAMGVASRVAATTTISACFSGITAVLLSYGVDKKLSVQRMGNGMLAGLVGITANCHVVKLHGAMIIGIVSAMVYFSTSKLLKILNIDDPLDAFAVHGASGVWGCLAAALVGTKELTREGGYLIDGEVQSDGRRFLNQFIGVLAIASWTSAMAAILFGSLSMLGVLRIDEETEKIGLNAKHETVSSWQFRRNSIKRTGGGPIVELPVKEEKKDEFDEPMNESSFSDLF